VCDLETSRIGAQYKYDISSLRVKKDDVFLEYVNAWTFSAYHLFTPQKELFLIGVN